MPNSLRRSVMRRMVSKTRLFCSKCRPLSFKAHPRSDLSRSSYEGAIAAGVRGVLWRVEVDIAGSRKCVQLLFYSRLSTKPILAYFGPNWHDHENPCDAFLDR